MPLVESRVESLGSKSKSGPPLSITASKFDYLLCNKKDGELEELFLVVDRKLKREKDLLEDSRV